MCEAHYDRFLGGDAELDAPIRDQGRRSCSVDGCARRHAGRGYCSMHLRRKNRWGDPLATREKPIGARRLSTTGYVLVRVDPADELAVAMAIERHRWALEHRLVMARAVGRALRSDETVHHINGDKLDNCLENLELWSGNHPSGVRVGDQHCPTCTCGQ